MGEMKSKRRKKDETAAVEMAPPVETPKVDMKKKARATDDALQPGRNGHANGNAAPNDAERRRLIEEAAYFRAVRRNFANGNPEADWLEAEAEVGAMLAQQRD